MRQFRRADRVREEILKTMSRIMASELAESLPGMVTFTQVKWSKDLRYATVYYSFLGKEEDKSHIAGYFERERKRLRHLLGTRLQIRYIPELTFEFDPSIEEGIKIERLLNEIKGDKRDE